MKQTYTPGPWTFKFTPTYRAIQVPALRGKGGGPKTIAAVFNYGPSPEADARLIAAAPQLLVSLTLIEQLACYATEIDTETRLDALLKIGDESRAALALAAGDHP